MTTLQNWILCFAFLLAGHVMVANPYTIDTTIAPGDYDYHYDVWLFQYTPESGWSKSLYNGNRGGAFFAETTVWSDDGAVGATVDVVFAFSAQLTGEVGNQSNSPYFANFAGLDYYSILYSSPTGDFTKRVRHKVGDYSSYYFDFTSNHVAVDALGLKVVDSTQPAAFTLEGFYFVSLNGLQASQVPDGTQTIILFGMGILAVLSAKRRLERS